MTPIVLTPGGEPVSKSGELTAVIIATTDAQIAEKRIEDDDKMADFRLSTDALNYHRIEWRLNEELGEVDSVVMERVKGRLCQRRGYDAEEFDAALTATRDRPRLPYGWTAMDLAIRRLETRPIRLLDPELEASRYTKGVFGLAVHLQELQRDKPILLPVEQVREALVAKKVVVAGTIKKLVELGLLEMTKSTYNTGSAREYIFRGVEGKDFIFRSYVKKRKSDAAEDEES